MCPYLEWQLIIDLTLLALREINQMEREMCSYLEWQLIVDPTTLRKFEQRVRVDFAGCGPYPALLPPSPTSAPSSVTSTAASFPIPSVAAPAAYVAPSSSKFAASTTSVSSPTSSPPTPGSSRSNGSPASTMSPSTPPDSISDYSVKIIGGDDEKMHSSYRGSYDDSETVDYGDAILADVAAKEFRVPGAHTKCPDGKDMFARATRTVW